MTLLWTRTPCAGQTWEELVAGPHGKDLVEVAASGARGMHLEAVLLKP
jgi:hypothetical protein